MMEIICFHNPDEENGYLGNWYLSEFEVNGIKFSSMEQFMMYRKAQCFQDKKMADKIYFTITGTGFFEGDEFFEKDMEVLLEKEPDNKYDHEAILVKMPGIGKVGHVANSCSTVIGESYSAGRIYDKIGDTAVGKVLYKMPRGILCELVKPVDEIKF